jgi:hypothetical protein
MAPDTPTVRSVATTGPACTVEAGGDAVRPDARYEFDGTYRNQRNCRLDNGSDKDQASTAQRHVIEAEQHIADLHRILEELQRDRHTQQAELAGRVLRTLEESLRIARAHLAREREKIAAGSPAEHPP